MAHLLAMAVRLPPRLFSPQAVANIAWSLAVFDVDEEEVMPACCGTQPGAGVGLRICPTSTHARARALRTRTHTFSPVGAVVLARKLFRCNAVLCLPVWDLTADG